MFELKIETDGAAFEGPDGIAEVGRIVRRVLDKLEHAAVVGGWSAPLYDINGNMCGTWKFEPQQQQQQDEE